MENPQKQGDVTDVIPETIIKRSPVFIHKEDIERVLMDKLPGHIADISTGGQWPGCRIIEFKHGGVVKGLRQDMAEYLNEKCKDALYANPVEMMNKFFELFANYLVVWKQLDGHGNIVVQYTSMLDEEDTMDLQEVAAEQRKQMNKKRAERRAKREAEEEAKRAETAALITLGKAARDHNLMGKLKELEEKVTELKKEVKNAKRVK